MIFAHRPISSALAALLTRRRATMEASRQHRPSTIIGAPEKPSTQLAGRDRNRSLTNSDLALIGGRWRPDHGGTRVDASSAVDGIEFFWTARRLTG